MKILPEFIKMVGSNLKPSIRESGCEDIMVFDVDYCLYQSARLRSAESDFVKKREQELFGSSGMTFKQLKKDYGSMKIGLMKRYGMTVEQIKQNDYAAICQFLQPDRELKMLLESIGLRKYCLTNGFSEKIKNILETLDIAECFEKVYCSNDRDNEENWILKPKLSAFEFLMEDLGIDPGKVRSKQIKIYYFDDLLENVEAAGRLGWEARQITEELTIHDALREFIKNAKKHSRRPKPVSLPSFSMLRYPPMLAAGGVQN